MWLPFPFPKCPSCGEQWAYSYHRDCGSRGRIEFDPDATECRCDACLRSWSVWSTRFHCACGHVFDSDDVDAAIRDVRATLSMFARIVEQNAREASRVHRDGERSLRQWIQGFASELAGSVGSLLGRFAGTLARILMGGT